MPRPLLPRLNTYFPYPPVQINSATQQVWNQHILQSERNRPNAVLRYMFMAIRPGTYTPEQLLREMLNSIDGYNAMITHRGDWPWYGGAYWAGAFTQEELGNNEVLQVYERFRRETIDMSRTYQQTTDIRPSSQAGYNVRQGLPWYPSQGLEAGRAPVEPRVSIQQPNPYGQGGWIDPRGAQGGKDSFPETPGDSLRDGAGGRLRGW